MSDTVSQIAAIIAGDALKATEALPILTAAFTAGMTSLTNDQHADLVTKGTDLLAAITPSAGRGDGVGYGVGGHALL
jgi:hypothetical protein